MKPDQTRPDLLEAIRRRLSGKRGRQYWRSLEEAAQTPEFAEFLQREFPGVAGLPLQDVGRRQFLQLMGASLALAGLVGCSGYPKEQIVPYVRPPEEVTPGKSLFYATAMNLGGYATGLLIECHEGRPTKIEGNPKHPASLGATGLLEQAAILNLYDPDRSQVVRLVGEISSWPSFFSAIQQEIQMLSQSGGAGLRILTETINSPTLADQLFNLLAQFPESTWHQYEPLARDNAFEGARLAFGSPVETQYHFEKAEVILCLDADFLVSGPGWVRHARDFIDGRRVRSGAASMNRLYVIESTPTNTGAMADHQRLVPPAQIETFARMLLFGAQGDKWLGAAAADLQQHAGKCLVVAGDGQPPSVHALAHALNQKLGNVGVTVLYTDTVAARPVNQVQSLRELVADMRAGKVEVLLILGGNPVYNAPADLGFAEAMEKVRLRVHLSPYEDETSLYCHWHLPESHFLEAWSDGRAFDGTAAIVQPTIRPIYDTRSPHEIVAALLGRTDTGFDSVRHYWINHGLPHENLWQTALHDGVIPNTALPTKPVGPANLNVPQSPGLKPAPGMQIVFRADPALYDGRFANNGWLQELPKPLTRITWDNVVSISPAAAERNRIADWDLIELKHGGRFVKGPVFIMPGQPDDVVTVHLGYGRKRAGHIGSGVGFDAFQLRTSGAPWFDGGLTLRGTGEPCWLASEQLQESEHSRDQARVGSLGDFTRDPAFARGENPKESLYPGYPYREQKWGMVIDDTACIACGVCVVACQAENNIPVVGKDQVARGRAMHWIRVDRYFQGGQGKPNTYFKLIPCMHCESAPCELVCPVGATVHNADGLNQMVYNRCVGTRYCSNNCPYKVRRFNFYQYADKTTESLKPLRNPNVTVRSRGVMEKCTYCIQRIQAVKIEAQIHNTGIRDGEIIPACAQACPTGAIVFGDLNDPNSRVARLQAQPHDYGLLMELNTRPRTTYLARIMNPNPRL